MEGFLENIRKTAPRNDIHDSHNIQVVVEKIKEEYSKPISDPAAESAENPEDETSDPKTEAALQTIPLCEFPILQSKTPNENDFDNSTTTPTPTSTPLDCASDIQRNKSITTSNLTAWSSRWESVTANPGNTATPGSLSDRSDSYLNLDNPKRAADLSSDILGSGPILVPIKKRRFSDETRDERNGFSLG
ncbi:predicted protein [Histoplasma mississippiense (nom. inval.)]|uniref:predicted protein n=1 Tax=Ajellomyces capsulatus (strain NAm1 / WU24) TaxID=2059318 RepID=UPI000157C63B|nr:predicted protein [Histoplasma mississippiense (nom. inval.)]EDN08800.1 predicted protein [Histoplasma mississippiense (nom. inval.)]